MNVSKAFIFSIILFIFVFALNNTEWQMMKNICVIRKINVFRLYLVLHVLSFLNFELIFFSISNFMLFFFLLSLTSDLYNFNRHQVFWNDFFSSYLTTEECPPCIVACFCSGECRLTLGNSMKNWNSYLIRQYWISAGFQLTFIHFYVF